MRTASVLNLTFAQTAQEGDAVCMCRTFMTAGVAAHALRCFLEQRVPLTAANYVVRCPMMILACHRCRQQQPDVAGPGTPDGLALPRAVALFTVYPFLLYARCVGIACNCAAITADDGAAGGAGHVGIRCGLLCCLSAPRCGCPGLAGREQT